MVYLVVSQMLELHYPSKLCVSFSFHQIQAKTFSQAGPKRCQWKIDVWIRESFRRQNGSDAGPESFELRVFLLGLRQKQH